jgi:hypothetical protein
MNIISDKTFFENSFLLRVVCEKYQKKKLQGSTIVRHVLDYLQKT